MDEKEYYELIEPYQAACDLLIGRIQLLNRRFNERVEDRPIYSFTSRIKKRESIEAKLIRKGYQPDVENAKENLRDIAGIRVVVYFSDEIAELASALCRQQDLLLLKIHDYVNNPKPNGYRSYHMVFGVPVYYKDGMQYFPVEVQFRTMCMDLWAEMEHRILYKREHTNRDVISDHFLEFSRLLKEQETNFIEFKAGKPME